MSNLRNDLAAHIRHVDGSSQLSNYQLADDVAAFLVQHGTAAEDTRNSIVDYIDAQLAGGGGYMQQKRLGAAALADAVVDRFKLGEEN